MSFETINSQEGEKPIEKEALIVMMREKGIDDEAVREMLVAWRTQQEVVVTQEGTERAALMLDIEQAEILSAGGRNDLALTSLREVDVQLGYISYHGDTLADLSDLVLEKAIKIKEELRQQTVELARTLAEQKKAIRFSGITDEAYENLKKVDEEYPGFVTAIDDLLEMCKQQGVKIVLGADPNNGNIMAVPSGSSTEEDFINNRLAIHQLQETEEMDVNLKKLLSLYSTLFPRD